MLYKHRFQCPMCNETWEIDSAKPEEPACPKCGLAEQIAMAIEPAACQQSKLSADQEAIITRMLGELNSALEADPIAVSALIGLRAQCNEVLKNHPTVQTISMRGQLSVGMVGFFNALVDAAIGSRACDRENTRGYIFAEWDASQRRVTKFSRYDPEQMAIQAKATT